MKSDEGEERIPDQGDVIARVPAGADEKIERTVERWRPEVCYDTVETKKGKDLDSNDDFGINFHLTGVSFKT